MAFEITGKIVDIAPVNQVSEKFRKREFVLEKKENAASGLFVDYIKFQLVQDRCDLINESYMNEEVKVSFNVRGNRWERDGKVNYFTNLDAWKIERIQSQGRDGISQQTAAPADLPPEIDDMSDLPF